jgi:hypothetical protein
LKERGKFLEKCALYTSWFQNFNGVELVFTRNCISTDGHWYLKIKTVMLIENSSLTLNKGRWLEFCIFEFEGPSPGRNFVVVDMGGIATETELPSVKVGRS